MAHPELVQTPTSDGWTSAGWICRRCNQWVPFGSSHTHHCPNLKTHDERIANALERIADQLEIANSR